MNHDESKVRVLKLLPQELQKGMMNKLWETISGNRAWSLFLSAK
jgi:hypothetical protein